MCRVPKAKWRLYYILLSRPNDQNLGRKQRVPYDDIDIARGMGKENYLER